MKFPEHIANSPTPRTDAFVRNWQMHKYFLIREQQPPHNCEKLLERKDAQQTERELIYANEVMERLAERLNRSDVYILNSTTRALNDEALSAYETYKSQQKE